MLETAVRNRTRIRRSGSVSRILFRPSSRKEVAIIPLAPRLPAGSSNLPGGFGRASLKRPPIWPCSVWGLPCPPCHQDGGALLPHLFTLATPGFRPEFGGVFSVALSLGSPSLAVSQHTALGVRTFLPGRDVDRGDHPTYSCGTTSLTRPAPGRNRGQPALPMPRSWTKVAAASSGRWRGNP